MFVQLLNGHVTDPDRFHRQWDLCPSERDPETSGWVGTTAGVSGEGQFFAAVRFASGEAARHNSDTPEQGAWWKRTSEYFDSPVAFHDCDDLQVFLGGGSDDARLVRVLEGVATEGAAFEDLLDQSPRALVPLQPDLIGYTVAHYDEGGFTIILYFAGATGAAHSAQFGTFLVQLSSLGDIRVIDLHNPWFTSPPASE